MSSGSISVSEILRASVCPMQLYLARSSPQEFSEPLHYSVAKQISYHLGEELERDAILDELKLAVPEIAEPDVFDKASHLVDSMIAACKSVSWKPADAFDVMVRSEKYNIHGRVDRMFENGFAIVKSGKAPTHGVYTTDGLQAACYSICLSEMYGREFYEVVEYLGSGDMRLASCSPWDRRAFLTSLREVERVRRGEIPRAVRGKHCTHCRFADVCRPLEKPPSLFERLFGKRQ